MPPIKKPAEGTGATPADGELEAARKRIAELEGELEEATAPVPVPATVSVEPEGTGMYVVICAGAPYMVGGDPAYVQVAMHGYVIDLVDSEARRLILLGAVRAANDAEVAGDRARRERDAVIDAQNVAGPASNPFGGRVVGTSLEAHAAEQIALAKRA